MASDYVVFKLNKPPTLTLQISCMSRVETTPIVETFSRGFGLAVTTGDALCHCYIFTTQAFTLFLFGLKCSPCFEKVYVSNFDTTFGTTDLIWEEGLNKTKKIFSNYFFLVLLFFNSKMEEIKGLSILIYTFIIAH